MSEVFDRLCPYYMLYGMTYDEYWYGDPWRLKVYKEASMLRDRKENTMQWLMGIYTNHAVSVAIANAFRRKGSPPIKYLEKPLDIFPKTEAEEKAEQEQKQKEIIQKLSAWEKMFNSAQKQK